MKKTVKLITLIISAILLIGAVIGITASADNAPTVAIKYKNLAYEGAVQILYAVEAENVPAGAKVQMYFYDAEPTTDSIPSYVKDEYTEKELTIGDKTYRAFFSKGIAPKNMRKTVYAVPVIVEGDAVIAKGDCVEYSIYTYATNMFAKSPTDEQRELYANLLDYGASVQEILLGTDDYTEADFLAAGGYADQYCGVRISTRVDDTIVSTDDIIYFRPGAASIMASSEYEGAFFTGFYDAVTGEVVGNYGLKTDLVLEDANVLELHKRYYSQATIDDYSKSSIVVSSSASTKTAYGVNSHIVSVGGYSTIEEIDGNKVFKYTHAVGNSTGNIKYGYYTTGKAFVFEADIKWLGTDTELTADNWMTRLGFVPVSSENVANKELPDQNESNRYAYCNFFTSTKGDALYITHTSAYTDGKPQRPDSGIKLNEWARVRFEYVPTGYADGYYYGVQRMYVDGVLAYVKNSVSIYDNTHMATFMFQTRNYENKEGNWGMLIDNSVCYTVSEDYYGQGLYVDHPDVNTYDVANATNDKGGKIVDGYNGNKVFQFVKVDGTSKSLTFAPPKVEVGEMYVFESDVKVVEVPIAGHPRNWFGRMGMQATIYLSSTNNDPYIRSNGIGGTPNSGVVVGTTESTYSENVMKNNTEFLPGIWYNLRVEYIPCGTDSEGYYIGQQKIYINNVLISDSGVVREVGVENNAHKGKTKYNADLACFKFGFLSQTGFTLQFDNTYIGAVGVGYKNDFENGEVKQPLIAFGAPADTAVKSYSVVDNAIVTDDKTAEDKTLEVVVGNDSSTHCINVITTGEIGYELNEHGVYELDFDIAIDPNSVLPDKFSIFEQFVLRTSGGYATLYRMTHIGDGKVRFVAEAKAEGNNNTGDTTIGEATILDGNWHNVRFVYYKNGTDSILAIYVDDVLVGVETGIYYFMQSAVTESSPITSVDWRVKPYTSSDATEATYYFDNISFTYAGPIPEVIPELAK